MNDKSDNYKNGTYDQNEPFGDPGERDQAARTVEMLESLPISPSNEQRTIHELGQLLRDANEVNLPPANDSMRELLVDALNGETNEVSVLNTEEKRIALERTSQPRFWLIAAASAALLVGAVGYSFNSFSGDQSPFAELDFSAKHLNSDDDGSSEQSRELVRAESEKEERVKIAETYLSDKHGHVPPPAKLSGDRSALKDAKATSSDVKALLDRMSGKFPGTDRAKFDTAVDDSRSSIKLAGAKAKKPEANKQQQKLARRDNYQNHPSDSSYARDSSSGQAGRQQLTQEIDVAAQNKVREMLRASNANLVDDIANQGWENRVFEKETALNESGRARSKPGNGGPRGTLLKKRESAEKLFFGDEDDSQPSSEGKSRNLALLNSKNSDGQQAGSPQRIQQDPWSKPGENSQSGGEQGRVAMEDSLDLAKQSRRQTRAQQSIQSQPVDLGGQSLKVGEQQSGSNQLGMASAMAGVGGGGGLGGGGGGLGGKRRSKSVGDNANFFRKAPARGEVLVGGGSGIVGREPGELHSRYTLKELEIARDQLSITENLGPRSKRIDDLDLAIVEKKRQLNRWEGRSYGEAKSNSGEQYVPIHENPFVKAVGPAAISTFSIDVDTASYANMRRFLNSGRRPPRDSVRIEELVNYFKYNYDQPTGEHPFSVNTELADCPWQPGHQLLRIGLKGKDVHVNERPSTNVVFLIDVSGSMNSGDKLPLLKSGFQMLARQLGENDRVSIVTYAGQAGVALEPTNGSQTQRIENAIQKLAPGGSTHGSAGIELAYQLAQKNFVQDGVNKVILATDGDLNVGVTNDNALVKLIKEKAAEGVFLTVLGFGTGNLKDGKLEQLADNGNGMYSYIDSTREAHRVLVEQLSASLVTIAKDVKIQIEFNPAEVKNYRLLGYENRMLATKDFDDDRKDAGEIGAGHTVTAIYQIEPVVQGNGEVSVPAGLKYQSNETEQNSVAAPTGKNGLSEAALSGELATVALRYKEPTASESKRLEVAVKSDSKSFSSASNDFRFAASVAGFGMLLRGSKHRGNINSQDILRTASGAIGDDASGYRAEFIDLIRKFQSVR